jgi:hypothetical protein
MAYDARRKRVVLFGGFDGTSLNDTWEWNGTSWARHSPATVPSPRTPTAMAYDPVNGVVVMVGGYNDAGMPIDPVDTWTWDGTNWALQTPSTIPPGSPLTMTFDVASGRIVLLAFSSNGVRYWEWNGVDWTARPARDLPPLNDGSVAFYDHGLGRLVVFGLQPGNVLELFELDGDAWTVTPDPIEPPARDMTAIAYDAGDGKLLLFGGRDYAMQPLDDLWSWNGARWQEIDASGKPAPRYAHSVAFDVGRGELVVVGGRTETGRTGETWAWNGSTWRLAGSLPPHEQMAIAYDARRGRIVAFGGIALGFDGFDHHVSETWQWDGSTWTEIAIGTGPPARAKHAMIYDAKRDRIVMFGGESEYQSFNDLWELDGATWTQRNATLVPARRSAHAMAYHANRATTVIVGGRAAPVDGGGALGDTWEWDGTNWTPIATFVAPSLRVDRVAAYHAGTARVVMFGGAASETWQYGYDGDGRAEVCGGGHDVDGDALIGCEDPDCWWRCTTACPPLSSCDAEAPRCGDGVCGALETCGLCAEDCGACGARCGDFRCDTGEAACPGDCGP